MRKLVEKLNEYTAAYDAGKPIISDEEWDGLYFKVKEYEAVHGPIEGSPTHNIDFQLNMLKKVKHKVLMLSLAKTKDINEFSHKFNEPVITMLKLDGLTCALTYEGGKLVRAETRGDGLVGEDVTANAMTIDNIPKKLNFDATIIGEVICKYSDFNQFKDEFKNPRNFAAGSIRLLDTDECAKRKLSFIAFDYVDGPNELLSENLDELTAFEVVPYRHGIVTDAFEYEDYPIDGLVAKVDDIKNYNLLGSTAHHPNGGFAFKFYDAPKPTRLRDIVWQTSKNGTLTPVAVFEPVEIDGTQIVKASLKIGRASCRERV